MTQKWLQLIYLNVKSVSARFHGTNCIYVGNTHVSPQRKGNTSPPDFDCSSTQHASGTGEGELTSEQDSMVTSLRMCPCGKMFDYI